MFKYIVTLICLLPISVCAAEPVAPVASADSSVESTQPLAVSVEHIIHDLERVLVLLDHEQAVAIRDNLYRIDAVANELLVKLIALLKIGKLAEAGITDEQLTRLAKAFTPFHAKLVRTLPLVSNTPEPVE